MSYVVDTSIKTWGNGSAIRLSKELLSVAGFHDSEEIEIVADTNQIIIKKRRQTTTLEEIFENYDSGFYEPSVEDSAWLNMGRVEEEW